MSLLGKFFKDRGLKQVLRNTSILSFSQLVVGVVGLGTVSLTARMLGVEQLGVLAVIQAYVLLIDKVLNFQSWKAVIKYGAAALETKRHRDFSDLVKLGFAIDGSTALLGTVIAVAGAMSLAGFYHWEADIAQLVSLYSLVILFNIQGTPTAVLRLFNRFGQLAGYAVTEAVLTLGGVIVAASLAGGLESYVIAFTATSIVSRSILLVMSLRLLRQQHVFWFSSGSAARSLQSKGKLWRFLWLSNLSGSLNLAVKEVDTLIVGFLLGPAPTGLYKVTKQSVKGAQTLLTAFSQAAFPDLARLWAAGKLREFTSLIGRSSLIIGGLAWLGWLVFLVVGQPVLGLLFGSEYLVAFPVFSWYLLGTSLSLTFLLRMTGLLSIGQVGTILAIETAALAVYFPALYVLIGVAQLTGAGIAFAVYQLVWSVAMFLALKRRVRTAKLEPKSG